MSNYIKYKDPEKDSIIKWLESEIDLCLSCDLPSNHLEMQLQAVKDAYCDPLPVSQYSH